jgi:hypothetical protein
MSPDPKTAKIKEFFKLRLSKDFKHKKNGLLLKIDEMYLPLEGVTISN